MNPEPTRVAPPVIGRCRASDGPVLTAAPGGVEKPFLVDGALRAGDKLVTREGGAATVKFTDGTVLMIGGDSAAVIDAFAYESDSEDDAACLDLSMGTFVLETGDLAIAADTFLVVSGDSTMTLRGARIAVRVDPLGYDMVTLLPPRLGPLGEVLVHNKIGVQMLNRGYQTLRLGGGDADIPAPLTLPSNVVRETYGGAGIDNALLADDVAAEDVSETFQPFRTLPDRFLERQFIARQVFPGDGAQETGDGDAFLEDAFDGTRFRLGDPDPETSS